jgi:hypothetical protein
MAGKGQSRPAETQALRGTLSVIAFSSAATVLDTIVLRYHVVQCRVNQLLMMSRYIDLTLIQSGRFF